MYTKTENGAVVFDSTGHTLLDLNFNALGMRKKDPNTIVSIFAKAYDENPLLAVRWLFYAGDIRQGMGESGRPGNRLGMQPWALSLPDKELCLCR